MKILEVIWFTNNDGCIGIVLAQDEMTKEHKAYIGTGGGFNEEVDTKHISRLGNPFSIGAAEKIFQFLKKD